MKQITVTVGTTATLVWKSNTPSGDNLILNTTSTGKDVHFGDANVETTTNWGFRLPTSTDAYAIHVNYGDSLYAAVSATTGVIHALCLTSNGA
jgi:hypothetical protein